MAKTVANINLIKVSSILSPDAPVLELPKIKLGVASRDEAERAICAMLDEAFRIRGESIHEMKVFSAEHTVERIGCALAAITLLADEDLV